MVDEYHARGCRACLYAELSVVQPGSTNAVGSVAWELPAEDRPVLRAWRESYNLCSVDDRVLVYASTDHPVLAPHQTRPRGR